MNRNRLTIWFVALLIILGFTSSQKALSQSYSNVIDSLIDGKPVSEQLDALHEHYLDVRYVNLDLAEVLCDTALIIAKMNRDTSLLARAYLNRGTVYYFAEEYDSAMAYYKKSIDEYKLTQDSSGFYGVNWNLAVIYRKLGRVEQSLDLLQEGLGYYKETSDTLTVSRLYQSIGNAFYVLGLYDIAVGYYDSAYNVNLYIGNIDGSLSSLINIGAVYETQDKFDDALDYYTEALYYSDSLEYHSKSAIILKNIGAVYLQTGENMKALDALFESLYLRDSLGLEGAKARTLILIGKAYEFEGNIQRANEMYIQSLSILHEYGDVRQEAHALTYIGKNLQLQKKYQNALAYYRMSLNIAKKAGLSLEISENYKHLVLLFGETQEEDSTLKYLDLYAQEKQKLSIELNENEPDSTMDSGFATDAKISDNRNGFLNGITLTWLFSIVMVSGLIVMIFLLIALNILLHKKLKRRFKSKS